MSLGAAGAEAQRLAIVRERFRQATRQLGERVGQIHVGFDKRGVELQRALEVAQRLRRAAGQLHQLIRQIIVRFGVVGPDAQRLLVVDQRLGHASRRLHEFGCEIDMRHPAGRIPFKRCAIEGFAVAVHAALEIGHHSQSGNKQGARHPTAGACPW